jgi:hypothetical protein
MSSDVTPAPGSTFSEPTLERRATEHIFGCAAVDVIH